MCIRDRFCGIHFFNPVRKMPLVEVIRGPQTSDATIATAVGFAKGLGKSPIVVEDGPGFLVNRLLFPYMNEALELLTSGVSIKHVDGAAKAFGMPMGPITLYDVVGLDTALFAGSVMHDAFPDRVLASPLLEAMVKAGRLGQKSKVGFFAYKEKSDKGEPDPTFDAFLQPYLKPSPAKLDPQTITNRLILDVYKRQADVGERYDGHRIRRRSKGPRLVDGRGFESRPLQRRGDLACVVCVNIRHKPAGVEHE